jgi:hypothetical protein
MLIPNAHPIPHILDVSYSSFLRDLDRISQPDWRPTNDDILYARLKTTGPETALFEIPGAGSQTGKFIRITDVGSSETRVRRYQIRLYSYLQFSLLAMSASCMAAVLRGFRHHYFRGVDICF